MYDYENLKKDFERLVDKELLFHAYLFFGESQDNQFNFALALGNYLENKKFITPKPTQVLNELLVISPVENTTGIDAIRFLKNFLYQKPFFSKYRTAIIKEAESLSLEAQNAMLKILEEPPSHGLIILISRFEESLFPAILSRLHKIYFSSIIQIEKPYKSQSRLKNNEIEKLVKQFLKINLQSFKSYEIVSQIANLENQNLIVIVKVLENLLMVDG